MTAIKTIQFDEYRLEPASFEHKDLAENWTTEDANHAGQVDPRFWLEQDETRDSYLVSDSKGPVLFFKIIMLSTFGIPPRNKLAEIHMQFMPATSGKDHARIGAALVKGCFWLEQILQQAGVDEIYFDSDSPGLVAFTTKHMGFTHENGRVRKRLPVSLSA